MYVIFSCFVFKEKYISSRSSYSTILTWSYGILYHQNIFKYMRAFYDTVVVYAFDHFKCRLVVTFVSQIFFPVTFTARCNAHSNTRYVSYTKEDYLSFESRLKFQDGLPCVHNMRDFRFGARCDRVDNRLPAGWLRLNRSSGHLYHFPTRIWRFDTPTRSCRQNISFITGKITPKQRNSR